MTDRPTEGKAMRRVIWASSLGTLIEWYDFYIFGSLATVIAAQFFPKTNPTAALLSVLATFAAGFVVRPFGALVFGRIGDRIGRKYTFLLTLVLMGGSTFAIGLVPGYESIGFAAPVIVLLLRLIQGLALGGEYGGAAIYVAEHAPRGRRGFFTSWIQTTATVGLLVSLAVILVVRHALDSDPAASIAKFDAWGWRIPFLLSIALVGVSVYIRLKMHESPVFTALKEKGHTSRDPLRESFARKDNLKLVLLALFGATMGQGVIWYTGQFYAQSFLENTMHLDFEGSRTILIWAIVLATPLFVVFGAWSDRIGRKAVIVTGMGLALITARPLFQAMIDLTTPPTEHVMQQGTPLISLQPLAAGDTLRTTITEQHFDGLHLRTVATDTLHRDRTILAQPAHVQVTKTVSGARYWNLVAIIFTLLVFVTMVYGPIAAFLVELFPARIRYTSLSLPYHVGSGLFGGLTPFVATLLATTFTGDRLMGLWYPLLVGGVCFVVGLLYMQGLRGGSAPWLDGVKRFAGPIWMLLAIATLGGMLYTAARQIAAHPGAETWIQWGVFAGISIPIAAGLFTFGWYAWRGEYDRERMRELAGTEG